MKRTLIALSAGLIALPGFAAETAAERASRYAPCAACHLPDGQGIPGAFPKLRNRAAQMAELEGGRDYLITVAAFGLMGPIKADGVDYMGAMPGHNGSMDAEAIAGAINHLLFDLTDDPSTTETAVSEENVKKVIAEKSGSGPAATHAIRQELIEKHGDAWPE